MSESKTYNGWTNYETWCVGLWIDNEQGSYNVARSMAQDAWDCARASQYRTKEQDARYDLSEELKNWVEENAPELGANVYSDLLNAALSEVNWDELADHYLSEVDKEEEEEQEEEEENTSKDVD